MRLPPPDAWDWQMPDGTAGAARLERRYRRLLRLFPLEHRGVHGEEMLGVLLAAARPGQDKPGRADTSDLIAAAARIRLRPGGALSDGDGWRDALAIFSVAAPVLMLASTGLSSWANYGWGPASFGSPLAAVGAILLWGQGLAVPFVLLGLRRWAAVAAAIPGLFWLALAAENVMRSSPLTATVLQLAEYPVLASALEVVALLASAGPRHGRQLMRGRHWALLAVAAIPVAALSVTLAPPLVRQAGVALAGALTWLPSALWAEPATVFHAIPEVVVLAMLLASWLSSAAGKRLAVLFGVPVGPYLVAGMTLSLGGAAAATSALIGAGITAMAAGIALAAAWRGRRRGPAPPVADSP